MYVRASSHTANSTDSHVQARTAPQNRRQQLRICQDALATLAAVEDGPALPDGHLGDCDKAS
jgi:hypothetical protein